MGDVRKDDEAVADRLRELQDARLDISHLTNALIDEFNDLDRGARLGRMTVTNKWRAERVIALILRGAP